MMLTHSSTGLIHLVSAVVAVLAGTLVLAQPKGTRLHRRWGYVYVTAMLVLNGTAFGIYRLFGGWGIFHYAATLSLLSLAMGFLPAWLRMQGWKRWHVAGMYWSVIGLYAALVSEIVTRIPGVNFGLMVGLGTAAVMLAGWTAFWKNSRDWMA
jgi:uncharacterized membrane protein